MADNEERRPSKSGAPSESVASRHDSSRSPVAPEDRFVLTPLRLRRKLKDWPHPKTAAWICLHLASYELAGRFESVEMMVLLTGGNELGVRDLINDDEVLQEDRDWLLVDYDDMYVGRQLRNRMRLEDRLAEADAKISRGEPLSSTDRWARHEARRRGADLPDPRKRETKTKDEDGDLEGEGEEDGANVGQTFANVSSLKTSTNLYSIFHHLTGHACSYKDQVWIDDLVKQAGDRSVVRDLMLADDKPTEGSLLGRVKHQLREGAAA